jgi:hypothetical protein
MRTAPLAPLLLAPALLGSLLLATGCQESVADTAFNAACDGHELDDTEDRAPDFCLVDLNTHSARTGEPITPRDYLEQVSGWYFIHST